MSLALFAMGAAAADGTGLRRLARPAVLRLSSETGDTTFLMARAGFNTICVDRQEGGYIIDTLTGHVGGQIPMGSAGIYRPALPRRFHGVQDRPGCRQQKTR